jgi:hypothetical protein
VALLRCALPQLPDQSWPWSLVTRGGDVPEAQVREEAEAAAAAAAAAQAAADEESAAYREMQASGLVAGGGAGARRLGGPALEPARWVRAGPGPLGWLVASARRRAAPPALQVAPQPRGPEPAPQPHPTPPPPPSPAGPSAQRQAKGPAPAQPARHPSGTRRVSRHVAYLAPAYEAWPDIGFEPHERQLVYIERAVRRAGGAAAGGWGVLGGGAAAGCWLAGPCWRCCPLALHPGWPAFPAASGGCAAPDAAPSARPAPPQLLLNQMCSRDAGFGARAIAQVKRRGRPPGAGRQRVSGGGGGSGSGGSSSGPCCAAAPAHADAPAALLHAGRTRPR